MKIQHPQKSDGGMEQRNDVRGAQKYGIQGLFLRCKTLKYVNMSSLQLCDLNGIISPTDQKRKLTLGKVNKLDQGLTASKRQS